MFVQDFEIHLIDGSVLPVSEPFEIEDDDSLIARFTDADQDEEADSSLSTLLIVLCRRLYRGICIGSGEKHCIYHYR